MRLYLLSIVYDVETNNKEFKRIFIERNWDKLTPKQQWLITRKSKPVYSNRKYRLLANADELLAEIGL